MKTCTIEGCVRPHVARGYCATHYRHWMLAATHRPRCVVEGCDRALMGNGLCEMHLSRMRTYGFPLANLPVHYREHPVPHDQLVDAIWHANATPLPPLEAIHNAARQRYAAQNERDGYLSDPDYIAAAAAWRSRGERMAAD